MKSYVKQYFADISILANDICQGVDLIRCHKAVHWQGKGEDYVMAGKHEIFFSHESQTIKNSKQWVLIFLHQWMKSFKQTMK